MALPRALLLAGLAEPAERVLADRLQQAEPRLAALVVRPDQRLRHQAREQVQHLVAGDPVAATDRLGRVERPAAGEHRQAAEQDPLPLVEQVVAPVDQRPERAVARQGGLAPAGQQPEAVVEPPDELPRAEHGHPGRRQLDRERDAVQAGADPHDVGRVLLRQAEVGAQPRVPARRTGARPRSAPAPSGRGAAPDRGRRAARPARRPRRGRPAGCGWSPAPAGPGTVAAAPARSPPSLSAGARSCPGSAAPRAWTGWSPVRRAGDARRSPARRASRRPRRSRRPARRWRPARRATLRPRPCRRRPARLRAPAATSRCRRCRSGSAAGSRPAGPSASRSLAPARRSW